MRSARVKKTSATLHGAKKEKKELVYFRVRLSDLTTELLAGQHAYFLIPTNVLQVSHRRIL